METRDEDMPRNGRTLDRRLILGDIQDEMIELKTVNDNPLFPPRSICPMLFELTIEKGTCFTTVLSEIRVVNDSIRNISSSNM